MTSLYEYRQYLREHPKLCYLFVELTDACNMNCMHCGSKCASSNSQYIDTDMLFTALQTVAEDFDSSRIMICLTGGEPLLHPDFIAIVEKIVELGFHWGITTNGTLLDESLALKLKGLHLQSVTVSLDGMEQTNNSFRKSPNAFSQIISGINAAHKAGLKVQVTTAVHKKNFAELEEMYSLMCDLKILSWKVVNMEPIGRALEHNDLMLDDDQMKSLLEFIREKRFSVNAPMNVCFGCSHYLSFEYEHELRDNYFICGSGTYVASILVNGDIYSCLDIERRPELVQGNVKVDRFSYVWYNGFKEFRADRSECNDICKCCEERIFCGGDSTHTWDFDNKKPRFCILGKF